MIHACRLPRWTYTCAGEAATQQSLASVLLEFANFEGFLYHILAEDHVETPPLMR